MEATTMDTRNEFAPLSGEEMPPNDGF